MLKVKIKTGEDTWAYIITEDALTLDDFIIHSLMISKKLWPHEYTKIIGDVPDDKIKEIKKKVEKSLNSKK